MSEARIRYSVFLLTLPVGDLTFDSYADFLAQLTSTPVEIRRRGFPVLTLPTSGRGGSAAPLFYLPVLKTQGRPYSNHRVIVMHVKNDIKNELWLKTAKNIGRGSRLVSTGPPPRPFAFSFAGSALLTHSLASLHSFIPPLAHSRARGKVDDSMPQFIMPF